MTDQEFYNYDEDEEFLIVTKDGGEVVGEIHDGVIEAEGINLESVTDDRTHADDFDAEVEKPAFDGWKYDTFGVPQGRPGIISSGPQVAYINSYFGLDGDEFTAETEAAVRDYQQGKGFRPKGQVSRAMYNQL